MEEKGYVGAWELLVRFHRMATKTMDRNLRQRFDHSLDDYDVLHQLSVADGPIRMGDLAARLLVANSSCNRIVGRLVKDDLVRRHHGAKDKREILVDLTADGRRLWRRMAAVHTRDIENLFGNRLTDAQSKAMTDAIEALLPGDREGDEVEPST